LKINYFRVEENVEDMKLKNAQQKGVKDLGVPKFLVNKWLNIQNPKSKFQNCKIYNPSDVSVFSSEVSESTKTIELIASAEGTKRKSIFWEQEEKGSIYKREQSMKPINRTSSFVDGGKKSIRLCARYGGFYRNRKNISMLESSFILLMLIEMLTCANLYLDKSVSSDSDPETESDTEEKDDSDSQ
jgi:hypothetical protein